MLYESYRQPDQHSKRNCAYAYTLVCTKQKTISVCDWSMHMHSSSTYMHSSKQRNQPGPRRKICCTSRIANRTNTAKETAHTHTHWYVPKLNKLFIRMRIHGSMHMRRIIHSTAANNETNLANGADNVFCFLTPRFFFLNGFTLAVTVHFCVQYWPKPSNLPSEDTLGRIPTAYKHRLFRQYLYAVGLHN